MGRKCFVSMCSSGSKSNPIKVSIFGAPKDESMLEQWRKTIPKGNRLFTSRDAICANHFEKKFITSEWFSQTDDGIVLLQVKRGKPKLAKHAIPTLFQSCSTHVAVHPSRIEESPTNRKGELKSTKRIISNRNVEPQRAEKTFNKENSEPQKRAKNLKQGNLKNCRTVTGSKKKNGGLQRTQEILKNRSSEPQRAEKNPKKENIEPSRTKAIHQKKNSEILKNSNGEPQSGEKINKSDAEPSGAETTSKKRDRDQSSTCEEQNERPKKITNVRSEANSEEKTAGQTNPQNVVKDTEEYVVTIPPNGILTGLDSFLYLRNNIEKFKLLDFSWVKKSLS